MNYLHKNCSFDFTSTVFNRCQKESPSMFTDLCTEGIALDNPVAHHKRAMSIIFADSSGKDEALRRREMREARKHLERSAEQGFDLSYFSLARLLHEYFSEDNGAFITAHEGAKRGEKFSLCLLGHFIAHGIGIKKDHQKGVSIMLQSGASEYYNRFATEIGIYYANKAIQKQKEKENQNKKEKANKNKNKSEVDNFREVKSEVDNFSEVKSEVDNFREVGSEVDDVDDEAMAFGWFKKAFEMNKTSATINNYGVCFMTGFGVEKDWSKAMEVFKIGDDMGDARSLYHAAYIDNFDDQEDALRLYKEAADLGNNDARSMYEFLISNDNLQNK